MRAILLPLLVIGLVLSGCLESPSNPKNEGKGPAPGAPDTSPPAPGVPGKDPLPSSNNSTIQKPWPAPGQAPIRPGVQVDIAGAKCTSNFVFRTRNNDTLYLGLAAHCVDEKKIGDAVSLVGTDGASFEARIAYSSWKAQNLTCEDLSTAGCDNDFALVEINETYRDKVSPAVVYFGGPTALVDSTTLAVGARVLSYGNSPLRFGIQETNRHEGIVSERQSGAKFETLTVASGWPGDSGSGVMTLDGQAAGILVTGIGYGPVFAPVGPNGIVGLKFALDYAKTKGTVVELCTWDLIDDGLLP